MKRKYRILEQRYSWGVSFIPQYNPPDGLTEYTKIGNEFVWFNLKDYQGFNVSFDNYEDALSVITADKNKSENPSEVIIHEIN